MGTIKELWHLLYGDEKEVVKVRTSIGMMDTLIDEVRRSNVNDGLKVELINHLDKILEAIHDNETEDCFVIFGYLNLDEGNKLDTFK